jgi:iron complex outermembrane receptor protein
MFKRNRVNVGVLTAFGAITAISASAQQASQRVEITGSSIKRVATEGALPVQIISQEAIKRSGATSVTALIQSIPAMQGFTNIADSVGGSGGGITTASLHDVGEQYTLVLLNGRRVAPSDSGTTIDLNSIPLAAIERIEILTDGASALYGADAIAGVVNFILKRGESPLTLDVRYTSPERGSAQEANFSISKGFGDLDRDGFSLFLSGSIDKQKRMRAKDRSFSRTGLISGTVAGTDTGYDFFNGSSRSVPPNVDVFGRGIGGLDDDGDPIDSISFSPYKLANNGNCPADHVGIGRQCFFDYTSTVEVVPERERKAIYGSGKVALGKSGWSAFADLAFTDISTVARIAPYPAEFGLSKTHPLYLQYVLPNLTPAQAAAATDANVKYRLYDMGNRAYDYNTKALHTVLGLEGRLSEWDLTSAVTLSKQTQDQNYMGGFPLAAKFNAALDSGAVDPFPYTLGTMPAAQLAALKATGFTGNYNTTDIKMTAWDGNAQRPLFRLGGGEAVLSVGFDMLKFDYKLAANPAVANAEILFDDPQPEFSLSRKTWGAYSEMLLPISKTLEATAGVRFDSIGGTSDSRNGGKVSDSETATTFKLGGKWQATPAMLLRASYGTGFRAASMLEIARPKTDFGVTGGTYNCPFSSTYDPLGYIAAGYLCPDKNQLEVFRTGNAKLKPEKSSQWNIGWVWQTTDTVSVGVNYWSVKVTDAVSSVSEKLIVDNPARYLSLYTTKFKVSNGKTYVAILDSAINIGKLDNAGIDWDLSYKGRTSLGKLEGTLAGTYLVKSRYSVPGTTTLTTSLGKFGVNDAVSFRNVITASGTAGVGAWEHTVSMNYRSAYTDQAYSADDCVFYSLSTGDCKAGALDVPEYMTFGWRTQWKPTKNLTLALSIDNLFDEKPPLSLRVNGAGHQLGYDPRYASPFGRTYSMNANWQF